jgi:hypothetical protein
LLDERLSRHVLGVGLAGDYQLQGAPRIGEQTNEPLRIVQQ